MSEGYVRITLRVTNFIDESDTFTESFETYINPDQALDVEFDVPSSYRVNRDDPIIVKATAENTCDSTTATYTYTWELESFTGTTVQPVSSFNGRRLEIAANVLVVGASYTYKCSSIGAGYSGYSKIVIVVDP